MGNKSGKISIAHVVSHLKPTGAELFAAKLASSLQGLGGYENMVISLTEDGKTGEFLKEMGIKYMCLNLEDDVPVFLPNLLCRQEQVAKLSEAVRGFDVCHIYTNRANIIAAHACDKINVPLIWGVRDSDPFAYISNARGAPVSTIASLVNMDKSNVLFELVKNIRSLSAKVSETVYCSPNSKNSYSALFGDDYGVSIMTGVNTDYFRPDNEARVDIRRVLGIDENDRVCVLVARDHPVKNIPLFIEAAKQTIDRDKSCHFIVCGNGLNPDNPIFSGVGSGTPYSNNVHILGVRTDINRIYAAGDIILCTSFSEGINQTLLEGMSCGLIPVMTAVGEYRNMTKNCGEHVNFFEGAVSAENFAEKILLALNNIKLGNYESPRGLVLREYNAEDTLQQYSNLINGIVLNKQHSISPSSPHRT